MAKVHYIAMIQAHANTMSCGINDESFHRATTDLKTKVTCLKCLRIIYKTNPPRALNRMKHYGKNSK
jgi:hypothetical protein